MDERTDGRTEIPAAEGGEAPRADAPERADVFGFAPEADAVGRYGTEDGGSGEAPGPAGEAENEGAPEGAEERPEEGEAPAEERARRIVDDLLAVNVPDGFDMDAAVNDEAFRQLLVEYPAAAAMRIYQAEQKVKQAPQQVADRLRARQSVPASTRPTQSVRPEPNYREMSSEDFFRMKERVAKNIF